VSTHAEKVAALHRAVLTSAGDTEPELREAAYRGADVPPMWSGYLAKVRDASYRVTDADIKRVLEAGGSEDAVFELTLATALGAATARLDAGLRALEGRD
jgi:hypothetical protein